MPSMTLLCIMTYETSLKVNIRWHISYSHKNNQCPQKYQTETSCEYFLFFKMNTVLVYQICRIYKLNTKHALKQRGGIKHTYFIKQST